MRKDGAIRIVIAGIIFNLFTMTFGRFAYTLILPDMKKVLGFSNTMMGLFGMGIVLGYLINSFLSGRMSDVIGERSTIKISLFIASIALFALGYFSDPVILFVAFMLIGAGASGSYIPMVSLINRKFEKKGPIFGIVMDGTGIGVMLTGYLLPPVLNIEGMVGYRLAWYLLAGINFLFSFIAGLFLLNRRNNSNSTYQREEKNKKGESDDSIIRIFASNRPLFITVLVYFLLGFGYIIYSTFFGDYAVNEVGFSRKVTGYMWSLFGINTIYSGILWGIIAERKNKVDVGLAVNIILLFSVFIIILFRAKFIFYLSTFLFGLAFMGFIIIITSLISSEVKRDHMAKTFGAGTFMHGAGQIFGTFIAGLLKDATESFKSSFAVSIVALIVSFYLLTRIKKMHIPAKE